jgi:hypothetical protein
MTILVDHDIEGHAVLLWSALEAAGWLELVAIDRATFADVGLPPNSSDRVIWRFARDRQLILLTGNRNMRGQDSLERTIREENTPTSLPVLTIGSPDRLEEQPYRHRCADRLFEIVVDIDQYLGSGRLFIP